MKAILLVLFVSAASVIWIWIVLFEVIFYWFWDSINLFIKKVFVVWSWIFCEKYSSELYDDPDWIVYYNEYN
jgi:hypothetical protein